MESDITGILLAGGQSSRMGTNKALVRLHGKPLIEYGLEVLREVTPEVILSTGRNPFHYGNLPVVQDVHPGCGPAGGIFSALQYSKTSLNLVLGCDMPFIPACLLRLLIEEARRHPADITLPADGDGNVQPLCGLYRRELLPFLEESILLGKLKLKRIVTEVNARVIPLGQAHPCFRSHIFLNMNSPGLLKQAEELWDSPDAGS